MLSILGFLVILGPLVIVHELGHYLFARLFGVKAEVFSIGFGPTLWARQCGETELRISAIPLGGYVKLMGEEAADRELTPEELKRSLPRQAPWKRFLIFFAGPLFNFIMAIFIFMIILMIGEPQLASVVGRVVSGSAAEQAGLRSGDRVLSIDGQPVTKYEEIMVRVNESPEKTLTFKIQREAQPEPLTLDIKATSQEGYSVYGESTNVGEINGMLPSARSTQIGISDPNSPAGKLGMKTGHKIVALNGTPIPSWEALEKAYAALAPGSQVSLKVEDANQIATEHSLVKPQASRSINKDWGIHSSELFIDKIVPKSPAEAIGMQAGDRLIAVGKQNVDSFFQLKDAVQRAGEKDGKVHVQWERDGKTLTADITPTVTTLRDPSLKKMTQFTIGIMPMLVWAEPVTILERTWNPFTLFFKATERMAVFSWRNIVSIQKMFTGDVSVGTLGGPILIGKIAGESMSRGLISFLTTMAILSVGLGVLNILPIPVLDGGHLALLVIEMIRGKPLTVRQMEIVQQVGLSLILLLMVVVIRNDLARLPLFE